MALTVLQIRNAKPGLRPFKPPRKAKKLSINDPLESAAERDDAKPAAAAKPQFVETEKPYKLADGHGLYLEVDPSGGKYWRFKYRFAGKEKRISLGVFPEVSLAKARAKRNECRKQLAEGIDPGVARKVRKGKQVDQADDSFEFVAREWLTKHVDPKSESHRKRVYARFENDIFPYLGQRRISEISAPELLQVLKKIEGRGAKDTAHRTRGSCGQVFRFGIATGRCKRDITADLRGALDPVVEHHFAAVTKPSDLGGILRAIDSYKGTFIVQCAFRLAPLVFVRPFELRTAKWNDFNLDEAEWTLKLAKQDKSKPRRDDVDDSLIIPLSRQAMEVLQSLHAFTGNGVYAFPGARDRKRPMSENAILAAFRRMGVSKEEMSGHGFRATARTILAQELKIRPDLIEQELGHQVIDPNGRAYNRTTFLAERRLMMQVWADYLDKLKSKKAIETKKPKPITDVRAIMVPGYV